MKNRTIKLGDILRNTFEFSVLVAFMMLLFFGIAGFSVGLTQGKEQAKRFLTLQDEIRFQHMAQVGE
jgi:hypothetical protein